MLHCQWWGSRPERKVDEVMRTTPILTMAFFATMSAGQGKTDGRSGDSEHPPGGSGCLEQGGCPSLLAAFRRGWHIYKYSGDVLHRAQAFLDRHEEIFKGMFRGTVLRWEV